MTLSSHRPFAGVLFLLLALSVPVFLIGCPNSSSEAPPRFGEAITRSVIHPIERNVGPVRLGMTLQEFKDAVQTTDQTALNPGLIDNEQSFEVRRESLPEEIRGMGCRFLNGRLYRITADYHEGAFDEVRWSELLQGNMERYGKVPIRSRNLSKYPTQVIQWEDSETRLVFQRERRMRMKSRKLVEQNSVLKVLLDKGLWEERQAAEGSVL